MLQTHDETVWRQFGKQFGDSLPNSLVNSLVNSLKIIKKNSCILNYYLRSYLCRREWNPSDENRKKTKMKSKKLQSILNKIRCILILENLYADGIRIYTASLTGDDILLSNGTGLDISLVAVASGKISPKFTNTWGTDITGQIKSFFN